MTNEIKKPDVNPEQWITVGKASIPIKAVVCRVYNNESFAFGADLEIVYLDRHKRSISINVAWDMDHWKFLNSGSGVGCVDGKPEYMKFVSILRNGYDYRTKQSR